MATNKLQTRTLLIGWVVTNEMIESVILRLRQVNSRTNRKFVISRKLIVHFRDRKSRRITRYDGRAAVSFQPFEDKSEPASGEIQQNVRNLRLPTLREFYSFKLIHAQH